MAVKMLIEAFLMALLKSWLDAPRCAKAESLGDEDGRRDGRRVQTTHKRGARHSFDLISEACLPTISSFIFTLPTRSMASATLLRPTLHVEVLLKSKAKVNRDVCDDIASLLKEDYSQLAVGQRIIGLGM